MSAYLCEDHHIDFLLSFMLAQRPHNSVFLPSKRSWLKMGWEVLEADTRRNAMDIAGQILVTENYRSLTHRYGDNSEPHSYRFKEHPSAATMPQLARCVQVLKACACFDYQACESPDYDSTDAARIITDIRGAAINALPGYDAAQWGAPERPTGGPISLMAMVAGRA